MSKKILVSSIPCWSQKSGSNTWSSLLSFASPEDVANIFIDAGIPDSPVASRYLNIKESEVVKSVIVRNNCTAFRIEPQSTSNIRGEVKEERQTIVAKLRSRLSKYHFPLLLWIRELMWKLGKWDSRELHDFITAFNPDVFIFSIESYFYFNRLNEYIIRRYQPKKTIAYMWDDNFTYKQHPRNILFKIERYFLRKQVRRLIEQSDTVLAISAKMKGELDKEYGVDSIVLTKPILTTTEFTPSKLQNPIKLLYTGKLIIGRDKTLISLVEAIKEVNKNGKRVFLDIYTTTALDSNLYASLNIKNCSSLHGAVPQNRVLELQKESDVLIFAESLDSKDLTARLSFSTKLTDYFSAGKCIWGIGNGDLGPISYLKEEDAGLISTSISEIKDVLERILSDNIVLEYAMKSYNCGQRNHNQTLILNKLSKDIIGSY